MGLGVLKSPSVDFSNSQFAAQVRASLRFSNTCVFEKRAALPCAALAGCFLNSLLLDQLLVSDPMWLIGVVAEPPLAVGFVVGVVAFEPNDRALVLERQHVRCDPIEKPAIVRDHDRATTEVEQRIFERAQCVDVEIV